MTTPGGRRERKKLETRDALRDAARRLFAEQGYAATTVEQISEAADVSERTFFRYFSSKDDLLVPDLTALFEAIEDGLRHRPANEHPLDAYLAGLTAVITEPDREAGIAAVAIELDPTDPAIAARIVRAFLAREERLTEIFAERLHTAHPELDPETIETQSTVTASIAVAATRGAVRLARRRKAATTAEWITLLGESFAITRAGCGTTELAATGND